MEQSLTTKSYNSKQNFLFSLSQGLDAHSLLSRGLFALGAGILLFLGFFYWIFTLVAFALLYLTFTGFIPADYERGKPIFSYPRFMLLFFIFLFSFFLPHLWWIQQAAGGEILALAALIIIQIVMLTPVAIGWALSAKYTSTFWLLRGMVWALIWTIGEWLRSNFPFGGFPWAKIAYSSVGGPIVGYAPYLSTLGTTFMTVFSGLSLGMIIIWGWRFHGEFLNGISAIISLSVIIGLGFWLSPRLSNPQDYWVTYSYSEKNTTGSADVTNKSATFKQLLNKSDQSQLVIALVQGGYANPTTNFATVMLEKNALQTRKLHNLGFRPQIVFWPESASDNDPRSDENANRIATAMYKLINAPLLLGTQRFVQQPNNSYIRFNDYLVWDKESNGNNYYSKQHPVPFGEYVPLRSFAEILSSEIKKVSVDLAGGTKPAILDVKPAQSDYNARLATPICFEIADDWVVNEAVAKGAKIIVSPTNSVYFAESLELKQQLQMSQFKAISSGIDLAQVSTNGFTGVISPYVNVDPVILPSYTGGFLVTNVHIHPGPVTFAGKYGNLLDIGFISSGAIIFIYFIILQVISKKRYGTS